MAVGFGIYQCVLPLIVLAWISALNQGVSQHRGMTVTITHPHPPLLRKF
jgi:hypothetical protein